ncbi:MAG: hypothetical protein ACOYO9_11380, partial [Candidatus Nanopelagicales bacterium]
HPRRGAAMSARVPQSGGRPWVAVHTWMLNDPDALLAGAPGDANRSWLGLMKYNDATMIRGARRPDPGHRRRFD